MVVNRLTMGVLIVLALLGQSCTYQPTFALPVEEGNIDRGRQAFIDHGCHRCHTVAGERLPQLGAANAPRLELGGDTMYVKAYSELLTSIINPDHRISERYDDRLQRQMQLPVESPMRMPHIDTMTVRQLIDIVAFLDSRYVLIDEYDSEL